VLIGRIVKSNHLFAYNADNELHNKKQVFSNGLDLGKMYSPIIQYGKKGEYKMIVNLLEVLPKKRIEELVKEEYIKVNMYVNGKGEILEVEFTLTRPTSITAKELELMENNIKKKGRIEILHDDYKGVYNFFSVTSFFYFKDYLSQIK
jgi:hypothetical protein